MRNFMMVTAVLFFIGCANKTDIVPPQKYENVTLQFKFIPEDTTTYSQTVNMVMTMEVQGMAQEVNYTMDSKVSHIVQDTGEITKIKVVFDDISGTTKIGEEIKPIKEAEELKGKSVIINLSRDGTIKEIEGLNEISYFRKTADKPERQFESEFGFLPNKAVKIGDTWVKKSDEEKTTYTLKKFETKDGVDCAVISEEGEVNINKSVDNAGVTGTITLKGTSKGDIWFALKEGKFFMSKISASLEGEQEVKVPTMTETMKIPVYIDQTREVKIKK